MDEVVWPFLIPIIGIIGGITYAIVKSITMARVRELEVRERIAMIERGLVPPPEKDPRGFERFERAMNGLHGDFRHRTPERHRSAAITLMGVGFGLMFLIALTDDEGDLRNAVGVGGFLVILGFAFLINSLLARRGGDRDRTSSFSSSPGAPPPGQGPMQPRP